MHKFGQFKFVYRVYDIYLPALEQRILRFYYSTVIELNELLKVIALIMLFTVILSFAKYFFAAQPQAIIQYWILL